VGEKDETDDEKIRRGKMKRKDKSEGVSYVWIYDDVGED